MSLSNKLSIHRLPVANDGWYMFKEARAMVESVSLTNY